MAKRCSVSSMQALVACIFLSTPLNAAELNICWIGSNGYTMTGRMVVSDSAMKRDLVTETDITAFAITGYQDGIVVGNWSLKDQTDNTTWLLRFTPETLTFPLNLQYPQIGAQGWNANGDVTDCGAGGFGFNAGNWAQDVCINGRWVEESGVDPATPLLATYDPVTPDCGQVAALSKRSKNRLIPLTANHHAR